MTNQDFDRLLGSIREDSGSPEEAREAAARVRSRMGDGDSISVARLDSCGDFRALFSGYRTGKLSEARQMLLEDHLHTCVACRRVFEGRQAAVIPISQRRRVLPWAIAAAAVLAIGITFPVLLDKTLAPSGARGTVALVDGELYRVSDKGPVRLAAGASVGEGEEIRTAKDSRAVVRLRDGSMVEMAERSDMRLSERWSGKTVRLERGAVMVEAAKQRRGRLEVITPDCQVSVKGTVFQVSSGTKGSRVSVVEGEVKVDHDGDSQLLHRGDQTTSNASVVKTSVAADVAWSRNSAKYLTLLGEISAIQKRIDAIPMGLRYQSKLAGLLPANTMVFASIPNLGTTLAEATGIFEERVQQSEVLREWWNQRNTQQLQTLVNQARTFNDYLGDEIVLAVGPQHDVMVVAEMRRAGLQQFLDQQFQSMSGPKPQVMIQGNLVTLGNRGLGQGGFLETPFGKRVAQSYQGGVAWLFAADMEQMIAQHVKQSQNVTPRTLISGLDNVRYLVVERKQNLGRTENSASLDFAGERHGLASWLAAPGPMGTLDFVSPDATFAGSFVIKNPGTLLQELIAVGGSKTGPGAVLSEFPVNDIAASLGGEMTVALDGPLLPVPSWKIAIEVNDARRLQSSIEQAVTAAQTAHPELKLATGETNGLTYYTLTSAKVAYEVNYCFSNGYWLLAPSPALLMAAIETRASGLTVARSAAFRAQLPQDGHENFSGLLYYNMGSTIGPLVDQLKSGKLMTPAQQKSADMLTANREPGLIYAYGEPDRIVVASRSGFFGLDLSTLLGLNAKGAEALPKLLPPVLAFRTSATRN
ncbi:MAG TPA: FecR domain-containing protein [Bryobacteraceae bacterium]|nr:FecR domain-containing protein [Bryobacteraceae bacterium]